MKIVLLIQLILLIIQKAHSENVDVQFECPSGSRAYGLIGFQTQDDLHTICLFCKNTLSICKLHSDICVTKDDAAGQKIVIQKPVPCYSLFHDASLCIDFYVNPISNLNLTIDSDFKNSFPVKNIAMTRYKSQTEETDKTDLFCPANSVLTDIKVKYVGFNNIRPCLLPVEFNLHNL